MAPMLKQVGTNLLVSGIFATPKISSHAPQIAKPIISELTAIVAQFSMYSVPEGSRGYQPWRGRMNSGCSAPFFMQYMAHMPAPIKMAVMTTRER